MFVAVSYQGYKNRQRVHPFPFGSFPQCKCDVHSKQTTPCRPPFLSEVCSANHCQRVKSFPPLPSLTTNTPPSPSVVGPFLVLPAATPAAPPGTWEPAQGSCQVASIFDPGAGRAQGRHVKAGRNGHPSAKYPIAPQQGPEPPHHPQQQQHRQQPPPRPCEQPQPGRPWHRSPG